MSHIIKQILDIAVTVCNATWDMPRCSDTSDIMRFKTYPEHFPVHSNINHMPAQLWLCNEDKSHDKYFGTGTKYRLDSVYHQMWLTNIQYSIYQNRTQDILWGFVGTPVGGQIMPVAFCGMQNLLRVSGFQYNSYWQLLNDSKPFAE